MGGAGEIINAYEHGAVGYLGLSVGKWKEPSAPVQRSDRGRALTPTGRCNRDYGYMKLVPQHGSTRLLPRRAPPPQARKRIHDVSVTGTQWRSMLTRNKRYRGGGRLD